MYASITNDSNKYYRTYNSAYMEIDGRLCVQVDSIPSESDYNKSQFYKYSVETTQIPTQVPTGSFDENGDEIYETVNVSKDIISWTFDETGYNAWVEEQNAKDPEKTTEEKLTDLIEQVDFMDSAIAELMMNI